MMSDWLWITSYTLEKQVCTCLIKLMHMIENNKNALSKFIERAFLQKCIPVLWHFDNHLFINGLVVVCLNFYNVISFG